MTDEERAEMEAELAEMRRQYQLLAQAPRTPVGENWRASRDEQQATLGRHITRTERLLEGPA